MTQYSINVNDKGDGAVTVIEEGREPKTWTSHDPNFNHILAAVHRGKSLDEVMVYRIPTEITRLSERVTVEDEKIHFDGRPVEGAINEVAMRYRAEGRDISNIVQFLERLSDNVSYNSRTALFEWLQTQRLEIDPEGYVIGYRGLRSDRKSQHAGGAYVTHRGFDGEWGDPVWVEGNVPNEHGTIVSMDRYQVDDNTGVSCSRGLHIGSEEYARSWADHNTTIVVRVDPADVVAVPRGDAQKMRVCRYEIIGDIDEADHEPESNPEEATVPNVEDTEAALDEVLPEQFRGKVSKTGRFRDRFFRRNADS